jgi:hypothetical protein
MIWRFNFIPTNDPGSTGYKSWMSRFNIWQMTQGLLGTSPGCHDLTCTNKMKTYKYNTVGTVPTSNTNTTLSEQFQHPIQIQHWRNSSNIQYKYNTGGTITTSNTKTTLTEQYQHPIQIQHCRNSSNIQYKYNTVGTVPTSNRKIVERDKIDTHNTHIQDHSLS